MRWIYVSSGTDWLALSTRTDDVSEVWKLSLDETDFYTLVSGRWSRIVLSLSSPDRYRHLLHARGFLKTAATKMLHARKGRYNFIITCGVDTHFSFCSHVSQTVKVEFWDALLSSPSITFRTEELSHWKAKFEEMVSYTVKRMNFKGITFITIYWINRCSKNWRKWQSIFLARVAEPSLGFVVRTKLNSYLLPDAKVHSEQWMNLEQWFNSRV